MSRSGGRLIRWMILASFLAACEDYATVEEVRTVRRDVDEVARYQVTATTRMQARVAREAVRVDELRRAQEQTGSTLDQMGRGFNVLSDAVEEAHEETRQVARRQSKLEREVAATRRPLLAARPAAEAAEPEPPVLVAAGRDLRTEVPGPTLVLTLVEPPLLERLPPESVGALAEAPVEGRYTVTELGRRLYALPEPTGPVGGEPICLDILWRDETSRAFSAARCDAPWVVYEFVEQ